MQDFLQFYHYYFAPIGQHFWSGAVYGNIIAVPFCAIVAYVAVFRKLVECGNPKCHRFAYHKVTGTHHRVCNVHNDDETHDKLRKSYKLKWPKSHKRLMDKAS